MLPTKKYLDFMKGKAYKNLPKSLYSEAGKNKIISSLGAVGLGLTSGYETLTNTATNRVARDIISRMQSGERPSAEDFGNLYSAMKQEGVHIDEKAANSDKVNNVYKKQGGGVAMTTATAKLSNAEYTMLDELGKAMKKHIIVKDFIGNGKGKVDAANGFYDPSDPDTIYISAHSERPLYQIAKHEVVHSFSNTLAGAAYINRVAADFKELNPGAYRKTVEKIKANYENAGFKVPSEKFIKEEIAADASWKMLNRYGEVYQIAKDKPGLAKMIYGAYIDIANKMNGVYKAAPGEIGKLYDTMAADEVNAVIENFHNALGEKAKDIEPSYVDYSVKDTQNSDASQGIYDYTKSFSEQLNDWVQGKIPQYDSLLIGETPEVFRKIGFNALPFTINQTHVDYAINGTKDANHTLGLDMLNQLPQALQDPIAIYESQTQPGRVVALVDMTLNGQSVVVPIEVDGYGRQNDVMIDSNAVVSVFAKNNAVTKQLSGAIESELKGNVSVFYLNNNKTAALLQKAGLQLPSVLVRNNGYIHSIRDNGSNVKPRFENVTESSQFKRWFGDWQNDPKHASKVVNEDGTPKIVYHGTDGEFTVFENLKTGKNFGDISSGMFFFTNYKEGYPNSAADYARNSSKNNGGNPNIKEVYLDIKKPLRLDSRGYYSTNEYYDKNAEDIYMRFLDGDYDGVIIENSDKNSDDSILYAIDNSKQIKSATDNIGTFDGSQNNIYYSPKDSDKYERAAREIYEKLKSGEKIDFSDETNGFTADEWQRIGDIVNGYYANENPNATEEQKRNFDGRYSDVYKNSMHKEHWNENTQKEADRRAEEFVYEKITNKETYEKAEKKVQGMGADKSYLDIMERANTNREFTADDAAQVLNTMSLLQNEGRVLVYYRA